MPRFSEGTRGIKGTYRVIPFEVADELISSDDRNPQIRVRYHVEGDPETIVSLGVDMVDMDKAYESLQAACLGLDRDSLEPDEVKLRTRISAYLTTEAKVAYVRNSFIQSFAAMPGKHRGKFHSLFLLAPNDTQRRCGISIRDDDGYESFWTMPWGPKPDGKGAAVVTVVGATAADDQLEVFKSKAVWESLITLGFNWDAFKEMIGKADAYYTSVGLDGEIAGVFADHENITPELAAFLKDPKNGGPATVRWDVIDDPKYGIGPKRGDYSKVLLTTIEVDDAGFNHELSLFMTRWDQLTAKLSGDQNARFLQAGKLTDKGRVVAKAVLKPVIEVYPDAVKAKKPDGSPSVKMPPSPETWELNGLVCATLLAARLYDEETVEEIVGDTEQLLAWVNLSVDEFQMDLTYVDEEEEEL